MPESDPLRILLAHNQWATRQILNACAKLSNEQFHRQFEMGWGSLHDTTLHILGATQTWTQSLAGDLPTPRLEQTGKRSPADLIALLEAFSAKLYAESRRLPLDDWVVRVRDNTEFRFTRGAVLMHVTTHAMHHRAQCLNMLRQLGVAPLPPSSVTEWARFGESSD